MAALQHAVVELVEDLAVGLHDLGVVRGQLGQEIEAEQSALPVHAEGNAGGIGFGLQALHEVAGLEVQLGVEAGAADQLQRLQAAGRGNGVARQRAGLVDGAQRRELFHDLAAGTECRHGHAAADDLAHHGDVGRKAFDFLGVQALGAAQGDAKARHDLVIDQQRAMLAGQLADATGEVHRGAHKVHIAGNRLHDDAGNVAAHLGKGLFELSNVVVLQHDGVLGHIGRHTGRGRGAEGGQTRAGLDQQRIRMAVVAAVELDDLVAAGVAARQAQRAHAGFGAGADQAHHVHAGHEGADLLGQHHFTFGGCAKAEAFEHGGLHGLDHFGVAVAQDHGAPAADVVSELLIVLVPEIGALGALHKARRAAHGGESAHGRVHAARDHALGALEQCNIQISVLCHERESQSLQSAWSRVRHRWHLRPARLRTPRPRWAEPRTDDRADSGPCRA